MSPRCAPLIPASNSNRTSKQGRTYGAAHTSLPLVRYRFCCRESESKNLTSVHGLLVKVLPKNCPARPNSYTWVSETTRIAMCTRLCFECA